MNSSVLPAPGYWIKEGVFSVAECDKILGTISQLENNRSRAGIRNLMANPAIREVANDERLIDLCNKISGKTLIPYKATLFEKTGKANWLVAFHQDTALPLEKAIEGNGWGPSSVKEGVAFVHAPTSALAKILAIRIHLDDSTHLNGPLRVIPNSHYHRLHSDDEFEQTLGRYAEVACLTKKGGIIAMSPLTLHASSKSLNDAPRRVLHIEYAESLDMENGIRLAIS